MTKDRSLLNYAILGFSFHVACLVGDDCHSSWDSFCIPVSSAGFVGRNCHVLKSSVYIIRRLVGNSAHKPEKWKKLAERSWSAPPWEWAYEIWDRVYESEHVRNDIWPYYHMSILSCEHIVSMHKELKTQSGTISLLSLDTYWSPCHTVTHSFI